MSKILLLAPSGFGKSSSIGKMEEYGVNGLNPDETYVISLTTKQLPFRSSKSIYPITNVKDLSKGKRVIVKTPREAEQVLIALTKSPVKNVVFDDFNYIMQDWYMDNALRKGWDGLRPLN